MDTGQLFMQLSARAKVDFSMPVSTSMTTKPTLQNESGSFDGVLKEAIPKHYNKNEQAVRTETKQLTKKVEQADEQDKYQQPREINSKSSDRKKISDSDMGQEVEKKAEPKLSEAPDVKSSPQNVDSAVVVAMVTVAQPVSEGGEPQSVATEDSLGKVDGPVRTQNAIPELQLAEGRTPEAVTTKTELDISGEKAGMQNAPNESLAPAVEVAAEVLNDKSQVQDELLVQNADSKSLLMPQTVKLQAGITSQEAKATEITEEQLPVKPVTVAKQNPAVAGQSAEVKTESDLKTVGDAAQQSVKSSVVKQKTVSSQEPAKIIPVELPVEADVKNANDLLQTPVRSQVSATTAEFKFSRSASVEASLGMVGGVVDQPREKQVAVASDSTKTAIIDAVSEAISAESSGSESGFMGKDTGGFGQQGLDLPKPGLQQMTNGQVVSSANISTGNVEQATSQQTRMASSENVAGQVKAQLSTREIKQGSEQITIQLSPDHLGDIKVNFRLEDQRLRVEIVAENRSARESLLQHADSLKESLARQNINMDKFEVTGGNNGSANQGGNSQPEWREMAKNRQSQQWLASGGYRTQSAELNQSLPVYFARAEKSTLDLHF